MHCAVTGGAGFIGSHIVDALIARGDSVTVLDDLSSGKRENLKLAMDRGATLEVVDVGDEAAVTAALEAARPEVVFHLAAQIDVRKSVAAPTLDARINILGIIAVLEAATRTGVRRLVNSSTGGALYGNATIIPTPEGAPIQPLAPYGQAKFAAEGYCELYSRTQGLSTVSLRYSNVYGPRQDIHGEAGVVAIFSGRLAEQRPAIIFGDGRQTRDWVDVSDVVNANLLSAEAELTGPVNIASGRETSVLDLVEALSEISGSGTLRDAKFEPARDGEVRRSCLDIARARDELGWRPEIDLRTGLKRVLEGS